jgi:hypothetical protein
VLRPDQAAAVARKSGCIDTQGLIHCLLACGFDPASYLDLNPDLGNASLDTTSALCHFLEFGYAERRMVPIGTFPQGLVGLGIFPVGDETYRQLLFKTILHAQVRHPGSTETLWAGIGAEFLEIVRRIGGHPYAVFGDSHAHHYIRAEAFDAEWLAGLPLVCHGASAGGLAISKDGAAIIRWAEAHAHAKLPIFLKFGGLDAEFRWITHRIRHRIDAFSEAQFDAYAARSVDRYGTFLDRLASRVDPASLRICSTFPATRPDGTWIRGYTAVHDVPPEQRAARDAALQRVEIPDLATRTRLRGRYNALLRAMCAAKGLIYIDAFTPFLTEGGETDWRYLAIERRTDDYYMDHDAIGARLAPTIYRHTAG